MPVLAVLLAAALVVLIAAVHWSKASAPAFRVLEAAVRDGLARWLATEAEDPRIAIVDIDEESLRRLGAWPWPRERLADLSEQLLSDAAASRVILDLVLPQAQGEDGDARLGALAASGLVVLGQVLDYERRDPVLREGELAGGRPLAAAHGGAIASATGFVANHRGLAAGRCVGNIGFQPDFDGQARRLAPWTAFEGQRYPMLSLAALACAPGDADPGRVAAQLPLGASGTWWVPFRRFPRAHLAVPAHEVLAGTVDRSGRLPLLNGRMVLVGSSALGLNDRLVTPLAPNASGVFVHAEALSWLLDRAEGKPVLALPAGLMPAWALLSGLGLLALAAAAHSNLWRVGVGLGVGAAIWLALAAWGVRSSATDPLSTPLVAYGFVVLIQLPLQWASTKNQLQHQTRLLRRYVAPAVLGQLRRDAGANPLDPRRAPITVLIADMQDYTRHTSLLALEDAARLTRGFLQALTAPVLERRGTLDRYTGDGLVAFWGAPIPEAEHADLALDAALGIIERVAAFNQARAASGLAPVQVRMGLASGEALVGDLGTRFRAAYTAVGDCINLASRLQQASREVGVSILLAESVCAFSKRHRFDHLGALEVRGLAPQNVATLSGTSLRQAVHASGRAGE